MTEVQLSVPEIVCDACASSIRKALGDLAGVERVEVDVPGKRVRVRFDAERASEADVRARIERAGFDVA